MTMLMTDNLDVTLSAGYSPVGRRHTAQKLYGDGHCSSSSAASRGQLSRTGSASTM